MKRFQSPETVIFHLALGLWLVILILFVLRQANPLQVFPSLDSGYYLYTGQQVLQGKIPYQDLWESKPPGIFYVNALALMVGRGTRWGVWALEFITLAFSAFYAWRLMRQKYGVAPALFGSLAWLLALQGVLDGGNLTEEYSLAFNFFSLWAFFQAIEHPAQRRWPAWVGCCFAASFLFRANNTGAQVAIVLAWVIAAIQTHNVSLLRHQLLHSGVAVVTVLSLAAGFLASQGILGQAIDAALVFNFALTGGTRDLAGGFANGVLYIGIPAGFALLGYLALVFYRPAWRDSWSLWLLLNFPLEIWLSSLSGRGYHHYYILWIPVLAFLAAWLFSRLTDLSGLGERQRLPALAFILFLTLAFFARTALPEYQQAATRLFFEREKGVELDHPVAAYLRQNTAPEEKVLVWGARLVFNYLSRRETPSAVLFYPLLVQSPISDQLAGRFWVDLKAHPPAVIVDTSSVNQDLLPSLDPLLRRQQLKSGQLWPTLPANIADFYRFVETGYHIETTLDQYVIYRRNQP